MMGKMGVCDWISWLIGLVAAVVVFTTSVDEVTWIPALLIAIAVGSFLGLVLSHLFCGAADEAAAAHEAGHGGAHHAAIADEVLAEAEAGDLDAGAAAAGIDPVQAAEATRDARRRPVHQPAW